MARDNYSNILAIRITSELNERLSKMAEKRHLNLSTFIRDILEKTAFGVDEDEQDVLKKMNSSTKIWTKNRLKGLVSDNHFFVSMLKDLISEGRVSSAGVNELLSAMIIINEDIISFLNSCSDPSIDC